MKVYFQYDGEPSLDNGEIEGSRMQREAYKVKITLPEKWITGPCSQLLTFFISQFNKKFPDKLMVDADMQLQVGEVVLPLSAEVRSHVQEYNDIVVVHKAKAKAKFVAPPGSLLCTNFGCGVYFLPSANTDDSCQHHEQGPVFHDTAKYWACCPARKALDWEEFEAIPKCKRGPHATTNKPISFKQEALTAVALTAEQKAAVEGGASTTATYESGPRRTGPREFEGALHGQSGPQQIIDGKANCRNFGCQKTFIVAENNDTACTYHAEGPVFWDTYKYWKCCPQRKCAEFDDFVRIPGCLTGPHRM